MAFAFIGIFSNIDDSKLIFSNTSFISVSQNLNVHVSIVSILKTILCRTDALLKLLVAIYY